MFTPKNWTNIFSLPTFVIRLIHAFPGKESVISYVDRVTKLRVKAGRGSILFLATFIGQLDEEGYRGNRTLCQTTFGSRLISENLEEEISCHTTKCLIALVYNCSKSVDYV